MEEHSHKGHEGMDDKRLMGRRRGEMKHSLQDPLTHTLTETSVKGEKVK